LKNAQSTADTEFPKACKFPADDVINPDYS
jgi:hypothetical protein